MSVTWQIDVRREVAFWVDRRVGRHALTVTARPTPDRDGFVIERTLNRRGLGAPARASLEETYRHLTSFSNVELPYAARAASGAPYRVAIRATIDGGGETRIATPELARTVIDR